MISSLIIRQKLRLKKFWLFIIKIIFLGIILHGINYSSARVKKCFAEG